MRGGDRKTRITSALAELVSSKESQIALTTAVNVFPPQFTPNTSMPPTPPTDDPGDFDRKASRSEESKQRKQITLVSKRNCVSKDNILTQVFSVSAASNENLFEQLFPPRAKDFPRSESTCAASRFPFKPESFSFWQPSSAPLH